MDTNVIATILLVIVTGGLVYYAYKQTQIQRLQLINTLDERFAKYYDIIKEIEDSVYHNTLIDKNHWDTKFTSLMDFFEGLDYLLEERLFDIDLLNEFYGYYLNILNKCLEINLFIKECQKDDPNIYKGFERLIKLIRDYENRKIVTIPISVKLGRFNKIKLYRNYRNKR